MTDPLWDLAVVGAGPAGATAALAALVERPDARVLLLDRARFPRDKSCGDGIAPHVLDVLAPLGAGDVCAGWAPVHRLELSSSRRRVCGRMARPARVIPREVFDAELVARAVAAGAELVQHRVRSVRVESGSVVLDGRFRARTVVAADGEGSAVRGALVGARPSRRPGRRAIAIRGYAPTVPGRAARQLIRYHERRPQPAYAWSFDRGDGWSNVGYGELVDDRRRASRQLLLDQLELLLPGTVEHTTRWRGHHLPLSGWGWRGEQPDGVVLYVGDAAGLVNPMTGEGIYYAVATGAIAGRSAINALTDGEPDSAGRRHRGAVRRLLDRHLRHTWLAARMSRRPAVVDAGITAAGRDRRTFDDLVELGLGDGRLTPRLGASLAAGLIRNGLQPTGGAEMADTEILAARGVLPPHRHAQSEITDAFARVIARGGVNEKLLRRVHGNSGVAYRHLVLPLADYGTLTGFGQANDLFIEHAVELGAQALADALKAADLTPTDVDQLVCATVTGLAIPSLDARIAAVLGLRPDLRRVPMVGLGCVAGAAGIARLHDYLSGHPGRIAALLTIELCSLTVQRDDTSTANLVASGLFGDGAAAVVARGGSDDRRDRQGPVQVLDSRSRLYPDSERTMGFDVGDLGLRIVLDAQVPAIVGRYIGEDVDGFLTDHALTRADIGWWVCHPGGPKVIDALRDTLGLTDHDLALTRASLAAIGNLSSASVLHVLADTLRERPPPPGSYGLLMALGPGFCSELVLLRATGADVTEPA